VFQASCDTTCTAQLQIFLSLIAGKSVIGAYAVGAN